MEDMLCEIRTHHLFQGLPQLSSDAQTAAPVTVTGYRRVTLNLPADHGRAIAEYRVLDAGRDLDRFDQGCAP